MPHRTADQLESQILHHERALGLDTPTKKLAEAALAIDRIFLDTAIITNQLDHPERLFGSSEWLGYLAAKQAAREYGNKPLNLELFIQIHSCFVRATNPDSESIITEGSGGRGGQFIDGEFVPITCTPSEIAEVNSNPFTHFVPADPRQPLTGFIQYPTMTRQERCDRIGEICDIYNRDTQKERDPYVTAVHMQRSAIGLHTFINDFNGRTIRQIVNWSLENADTSPCTVENADGDLFSSAEAWIDTLRQGSMRYSAIKAKVEQGETGPAVIFDLVREKQNAASLASAALRAVQFTPNGWHDHGKYRRFLASVS